MACKWKNCKKCNDLCLWARGMSRLFSQSNLESRLQERIDIDCSENTKELLSNARQFVELGKIIIIESNEKDLATLLAVKFLQNYFNQVAEEASVDGLGVYVPVIEWIKRGFIYFNDGKEYNRGFNEGATEFFATEFVGKNIDSPYEFQEALVEQLSMCLGYNTVKDAYFYSEDSIIRAAFNDISNIYPRRITEDGVEYDTYDTFACTCFTMWAYGTLNDFQTECATFTALEEQLLYLASKTGNTEECKKSLEKFLKDFGVDDSTLLALFDIKYLRSI